MSKTLVAYFSASGVTGSAAKEIAKATGADLHEIQPATPYTDADLNWMNKNSRSSAEMNDENSRPGIANAVTNLQSYDTIFVGFPIWWYVEPRIIDTFMESGDFAGKTVIPFATSGGSGIERAQQHLKQLYPQINWKHGKLVNRRNAADWASKQNI